MYSKFEQLLRERHLTTYKVSKDTNIAPSTFCDWKYGRSTPKLDKLTTLSNYFDVPLEFFLKV